MTEEKLHPNKESIEEFLESFKMASERKRLGFLNGLEDRSEELLSLGSNLMSGFDSGACDWAPGFILQLIHKTDENFVKNTLNCEDLAWFDAARTGPLPLVSVKGEDADPKFIAKTPAIASSNDLDSVLFVVLPQELDCSPEPINSSFNLDEYVDAIYYVSVQLLSVGTVTSVHVLLLGVLTSVHVPLVVAFILLHVEPKPGSVFVQLPTSGTVISSHPLNTDTSPKVAFNKNPSTGLNWLIVISTEP